MSCGVLTRRGWEPNESTEYILLIQTDLAVGYQVACETCGGYHGGYLGVSAAVLVWGS